MMLSIAWSSAHRADEVEEGEKLHQIVLNGCPADNDGYRRGNAPELLCNLGARILDLVALQITSVLSSLHL